MPQHISFGELNTVGARPSIGSRFVDSKALMQHALEGKQKPMQQIQDQISVSEKAIAKYYEMQRLLEQLQQAVRPLQTASLYEYGLDSIFDAQFIDAQTNNSKPASYYCDIRSNGKHLVRDDSFEFKILQIAKPHVLQTVKVDSSAANITQLDGAYDNGLFNCGVFQINSVNVTVEAGNCLTDIADNINAASANVTASINRINQQYRLVLESQQTGAANTLNITDTNNILNGMFGNFTDAENLRSVAQDARLMFVGDVDIYIYSTNLITDFIPGLTLDLYRPTNEDIIQLEINTDVEAITHSMMHFISAYNEFIDFVASQQRRERNEQGIVQYSPDAYLHRNTGMLAMQNILYQTISSFQTANTGGYSSIYNIDGIEQPKVNIYGDAGLNVIAAFKLYVDARNLQRYISNNAQELQQLMQSKTYSNSTDFSILNSGSFLSLGNFTVNINATDAANLNATLFYYNYNTAQLQNVSATFKLHNATDITQGGTISTANDEIFGDMMLGYTGKGGLDYAGFNTSYGLADQLGDALSAATQDQNIVDTGLLDLQMKKESLQYKLTRAQTEYERGVQQAVSSQTSAAEIEKQNIIIEQLIQQANAAYSRH